MRRDEVQTGAHARGQLIFHKAGESVGRDGLFNKWCWENCVSTCKRVKLDLYLIPHVKINSKGITGLSGGAKTKTPV